MSAFNRLFCDHPASVGETYFQHLRAASGFAFAMFGGGAACLIHALIPGMFGKTASRTIGRLHVRMVIHRNRWQEQDDAVLGGPLASSMRKG